jgi:hypothetical protein
MTRALLLPLLLAACAEAPPEPGPLLSMAEVAPDAEGRCWATDAQPAAVETDAVQGGAAPPVLGEPGDVRPLPAYRSPVRREIAREPGVVTFETLCPPAYTPDLVASLQRALQARGLYHGKVDGSLGPALGRAIQDFQRAAGPDSPILSLDAARDLGLVALSREEIDRL